MSNKTRLDVLLTEQGLQESRQKAQATIMSGLVFVNGQRVDKPGTAIPNDAKIEIRGNTLKYVSRGGLKLEKAMAEFPIELNGCICGDIGASTGGFTDCMLQNGASKVYSVDVGYGQLAWKLREDPRVVCMERTNARYLTHEQIPDELDFASIDVSFISLKLILPAVANVLKDGGYVGKDKFDALEARANGLQAQLSEANGKLEGYDPEWKAKAQQMQQEANQKVEAVRFDYALKAALTAAKAKNPELVAKSINRDALKLTDAGLVGLEEQLKALKESDGYLFEGDKPAPEIVKPGSPIRRTPAGGGDLDDFYANNPFYKKKA